MNVERRITEILKRLHPNVDYTRECALVDDGILDSLDIVTLVTELNAAFDITVPATEILPDRFNSVAALCDMVRRLDDI